MRAKICLPGPKLEAHRLIWPSVIYNQIRSRREERSKRMRVLQAHFQARRVALYNPRFVDKCECYKVLSGNQATRAFVPETTLLTGSKVLHDNLRRFEKVYLKPGKGSLGQGVYTVSRYRNSGQYVVTESAGETRRLAAIKQVWRMLQPKVERREYLVQRAIPLVSHGGRMADFRTVWQRQPHGGFAFSFGFAKLGRPQAIITNVAGGGEVMDLPAAMELMFPGREDAVPKELMRVSGLCAAVLGEALGQNKFVELALDMAVTAEGKVMFLEANSKYSRMVLQPETRQRSFNTILDYILAQF